MRRVSVMAGMALLLFATSSMAQTTNAHIAGGPHDLSAGSALRTTNTTIDGQTCIFCHVPHGGSTAVPLWNRSNPTGSSYSVYTSSTAKVTAPTGSTIAAGISGACLSCHDGTIAVDVLTNVNGVAFAGGATFTKVAIASGTGAKATYTGNDMTGGLPFLGTDLRNDHPVAVSYNTAKTADSSHYAATTTGSSGAVTVGTAALPLYGATSTVECASCHDAHDNSKNGTNGGFLRTSNTGSAMCLTCHVK